MKTTIWLALVGLALSFAAQGASFENEKYTNLQPRVCSTLQKLLALRQLGHAPSNFEVDWEESGGGTSYPKIDIDGDGIDDKIIRSCGSGLDALCALFIDLSGGGHFELEGRPFFLARVKSSLYAIQGETYSKGEKNKQVGKRRAYQITKQGIKQICSHI